MALVFGTLFAPKNSRCLPKDAKFPNGFCMLYDEIHWRNEVETLRLLDDVIKP